jgi:t-SNARE complex subunit (syntaxin)
MKVTFLPSKASGTAEDDDQSQLVNNEETQAQAQNLQETLEFEQGMLLEREDRIRQIESDIVDVNDIMRDLGTMVHGQGEAIDTIEGNIDGAYHEVEAGTQELQKAATYQTKYRKRLFCLLATGFIILIIVIILLATQLKS